MNLGRIQKLYLKQIIRNQYYIASNNYNRIYTLVNGKRSFCDQTIMASLMRRDLITVENGKIKLTAMGQIITTNL